MQKANLHSDKHSGHRLYPQSDQENTVQHEGRHCLHACGTRVCEGTVTGREIGILKHSSSATAELQAGRVRDKKEKLSSKPE